MKRSAIALLITLLFVISISVAIGVGLKQVKDASRSVQNESFMIESSVILNDVLKLLKTDKDLDLITKADTLEDRRDALSLFLAGTSFIPFESSGVKVILEIQSARAKFNPNTLVDTNKTEVLTRVESLNEYFVQRGVEGEYINFLLDDMKGIKEDGDYKSELFRRAPSLFRDYISSAKQLAKINDVYKNIYHTNSLKKIAFENLFYYDAENNSSTDLNYAPKEVWSMMLGVDDERAQQLVDGEGGYASLNDLQLSDAEKEALQHFKISFYEPYLDVKVEILKTNKNVKIQFEYDLTKKKGSHFIYELQ